MVSKEYLYYYENWLLCCSLPQKKTEIGLIYVPRWPTVLTSGKPWQCRNACLWRRWAGNEPSLGNLTSGTASLFPLIPLPVDSQGWRPTWSKGQAQMPNYLEKRTEKKTLKDSLGLCQPGLPGLLCHVSATRAKGVWSAFVAFPTVIKLGTWCLSLYVTDLKGPST